MTSGLGTELINAVNDPAFAESGGSHNQKGVEFQRHWALLRMFEMADEGAGDFLFLFEVAQDVAILNSETTPSSIRLYQVKKKDRKEWTWNELTHLQQPKPASATASKANKDSPKSLSVIKASPLGKLYAAVWTFKQWTSVGAFVSNAGCDLPLANSKHAATSMPSALASLAPLHLELLKQGLATLHENDGEVLDLANIRVEKTVLPASEPGTFLVGVVHAFLQKRSPRHAGQARALVDSLLAKIAPLGARTESCNCLAEVRVRHGYSKAQFDAALGDLEGVPDVAAHLETWLNELSSAGMGAMEIMSMRISAASIYRRQVMGNVSIEEQHLIDNCDAWLSAGGLPLGIRDLLEAGTSHLMPMHASMKRADVMTHLAIRAIKQCVDPT